MSGALYEAFAIIIVGLMILVSVIKFIRAFYSNPQKSIQLIRLNKHVYIAFIMFLSINFVFTLGYLLQIVIKVKNSNLIAILIYAIGISLFFIFLSSIISKKISI